MRYVTLFVFVASALVANTPMIAADGGVSAGAAVAVGLAAVIGIKIAALAAYAISRRGGRRRGGRGHGRGRWGRDVGDEEEDNMEALLAADESFVAVHSVDKLGCGMRLVCELEARREEVLDQDEQLILSLFGANPESLNYFKLRTPKAPYNYAAYVGARNKSTKVCSELYKACPFSSEKLMEALRAAV